MIKVMKIITRISSDCISNVQKSFLVFEAEIGKFPDMIRIEKVA